jgi:hypothetical protein
LTTDFRDVVLEVLSSYLGAGSPAIVFPGYDADPKNYRGLIRT